MTKDDALKLALETLEQLQGGCTDHDDGTVEAITVWCPEVISAIEEALAQPAQKPVAWLYEGEYSSGSYSGNYFAWNVTMNKNATNAARKVKPLYTIPPQRPWVGLTNDDIFAAVRHLYGTAESACMGRIDDIATARAVEAKLKERNS